MYNALTADVITSIEAYCSACWGEACAKRKGTVFVRIIYGGFVSAVVSAVPLRCLCGASAVLCGASAVPLRCLCGASADASALKEQASEKRMNGQKRAKNETERRAKAPP